MSKELAERLRNGLFSSPLTSKAADLIEQQAAQIEVLLGVLKSYDGSRALDQWDEDIMPSREWSKSRWEALSITPSDALQQVKDRVREECANTCKAIRFDDGDGQHVDWYKGIDACIEQLKMLKGRP